MRSTSQCVVDSTCKSAISASIINAKSKISHSRHPSFLAQRIRMYVNVNFWSVEMSTEKKCGIKAFVDGLVRVGAAANLTEKKEDEW